MPNENCLSRTLIDDIRACIVVTPFIIQRIDSQEWSDESLLSYLLAMYQEFKKPLAVVTLLQPDLRCARFFSKAFKQHLPMHQLILQQIDQTSARAIASALKAPWCELLYLGLNQVEKASAEIIGAALASQWCKVKRVGLQGLSEEAMQPLLKSMLSRWCLVRELVLRDLNKEAIDVLINTMQDPRWPITTYTLQGLDDDVCALLYESFSASSAFKRVHYVGSSLAWSEKFLWLSLFEPAPMYVSSASHSPMLSSSTPSRETSPDADWLPVAQTVESTLTAFGEVLLPVESRADRCDAPSASFANER